jgi:hypothetical protein
VSGTGGQIMVMIWRRPDHVMLKGCYNLLIARSD